MSRISLGIGFPITWYFHRQSKLYMHTAEDNQVTIAVNEHFSQLVKLQVTFAVSKLLLTFRSTAQGITPHTYLFAIVFQHGPMHILLRTPPICNLFRPPPLFLVSLYLKHISFINYPMVSISSPSGSQKE